MIKAVVFDLDGTLYSYNAAHEVAYDKLCKYAEDALGMDRATFSALHSQAMDVVAKRLGGECAALHNRLLRYQTLLELARLPLHPHALVMNDLYWDTLIAASVPSPGSIECLSALKGAGYVLGIGTDMTVDYQLKKLTKLQMLPYFDFVVTSEEVLAEKPDKKLFFYCAEKAEAAPGQCLFIGDNLKKDIFGAIHAGMQALWYCPDNEQRKEHPEIESFAHYDELTRRLVRNKRDNGAVAAPKEGDKAE